MSKKHQDLVYGITYKTDEIIDLEKDGSISFRAGLITYEQFKEALNNLFLDPDIQTVAGKDEDFVMIKRKIKISVL